MSIVETISYELWDKDPEAFANQLGKNHKATGFCGIQDHPIPEKMVSESIEMFEEYEFVPKTKLHIAITGTLLIKSCSTLLYFRSYSYE